MKYQVKYSHALGNGLAECLNAIVKLRRFEEPSVQEIAEQLRGNSLGDINRFLRSWRLKAEFFGVDSQNPKMISIPIFLETELGVENPNNAQDVLTCYDFFNLHGFGNFEAAHFSLVTGYDAKVGVIGLQDSCLKEPDAIGERVLFKNAMYRKEHGFYVVGRD